MSEDKPPYRCGEKVNKASKIKSESSQNRPPTCEKSDKVKSSFKPIIKSREDIKEQKNVYKEVVDSKLDQLDKPNIRVCKKKRISFAEHNYNEENKTICRKKRFDKIISQNNTDNKVVSNPEETAAEERKSVEENLIILNKKCCKVAAIPESGNKLLNEVKQHKNLEENTILDAGDKVSLGKKDKYYYTDSETTFLKELKNLFKTKKRKKSKLFSCCQQIEKSPDSKCKVRIEAWETHDSEKCPENGNEYKYIGELLFPVCSNGIFYRSPGVILRKSQKSYTLNDPEKFGAPIMESRQYAYSDKVIPESLLDWSTDEPEVNEISPNLPEFPKSKQCFSEN